MNLLNLFRGMQVLLLGLGGLLVYALSSGPVLATAFVLREATGWNGFYGAFWIYLPLLAWNAEPIRAYIDWWVWAFGTVGPG